MSIHQLHPSDGDKKTTKKTYIGVGLTILAILSLITFIYYHYKRMNSKPYKDMNEDEKKEYDGYSIRFWISFFVFCISFGIVVGMSYGII